MKFVLPFSAIGLKDIAAVGGKNASLGEMISHLSHLGIQVPPGFAITVAAYKAFLKANQLEEKIIKRCQGLDVSDVHQLEKVSADIQQFIHAAFLPDELIKAITEAYQGLDLSQEQSVAVRSSATMEDLHEASFAGQQESYLNVCGIEEVLAAVKRVYASLFSERAIAYRVHHNFSPHDVDIAVGVQLMVRSDKAASGVIFTLDTETGFENVVLITAAYGLGEALVKGIINPDEFIVYKPTLHVVDNAVISRKLGCKKQKMIYASDVKQPVKLVKVPEEAQMQYCLKDSELMHLAKQACLIERHYGKPMDIEWAKDGINGQLYILQARPETVMAHKNKQVISQYELLETVTPITKGRSVGQKIGSGVARVLSSPREIGVFKPGEILVADMTDPDWEPIMKHAAAIVTNRGGRTCHAAIVARELGIPAVIGCIDATTAIQSGNNITVSCAEGETGYVYPGLLKYTCHQIEVETLPTLPIKVCMNLANPEQAFSAQFLPNDGIGLARLEFIISNSIGIHPNAILKFSEMPQELQQNILKKTAGYSSPIEFYIEKLAEGISVIAAAFHPKPIIVRFSDFKSNEYANLLGGSLFEPAEENPMIGYRGASRYISGVFADCFAFECEAILRVREQKGLTNTHVMFPFVRTLEEAKQLIAVTKGLGLVRGKAGLQMYMMCEIPSNAILAKEFLAYFDGFSIGSNDLTQLTLGLDRDSALVSELFDERNLAVKTLLHQVIQACRAQKKYVGICGQGPSDHLDFAAWLMQEGIDAISLTPDSIMKTWIGLAELKKEGKIKSS